jgi:hypothetical protein
MDLRELGRTGVQVSPLCLGTMMFGAWGNVLDRIDEIVPPGRNVNPADKGWQNPSLEPDARRR